MLLRKNRLGVTSSRYEGENGIQAFHAQNRIPTSSVLMKKSVFYEYGFIPEYLNFPMFAEDYLYWVKILDKGAKQLGINEALFLYLVHSESTIGEEIWNNIQSIKCEIEISEIELYKLILQNNFVNLHLK
jgi:hypothetical protein